jgi:enoyl-CoA hydratase/carnithine racemase
VTRAAAGVRWSIDDGVAWITLARPRRGNRVDLGAAQALCAAAEEIELDDRVAVAVVSGSGRAFCLGVEDGGAWETERTDWVDAVARLTCPVLAALNGDAVAEGCELALACDLRLAAPGAALSLPQVADGRLPRHGATQRLPRLIGRARALDLLLSGRRVGAREAARIGLVSRVAAGGFAAALRAEVASLREKGPVALRLGKEAVQKGIDLTLEQGLRLEQDLYVLLQTTADRGEGVRAFRERRRPRFRGR